MLKQVKYYTQYHILRQMGSIDQKSYPRAQQTPNGLCKWLVFIHTPSQNQYISEAQTYHHKNVVKRHLCTLSTIQNRTLPFDFVKDTDPNTFYVFLINRLILLVFPPKIWNENEWEVGEFVVIKTRKGKLAAGQQDPDLI